MVKKGGLKSKIVQLNVCQVIVEKSVFIFFIQSELSSVDAEKVNEFVEYMSMLI